MGLFKRSGASRGGQRKLFFATDLHGSEVCFRKFLNAAGVYDASLLVLGGDVVGKGVVPLVADGGGYRVGADAGGERLEGEPERRAFERSTADRGDYCVVVDEDEAQRLAADPDAVVDVLNVAARDRLASWVALATERLDGSGVRCVMTGGNDDPQHVLDVVPREGPFSYCEGRVVDVGDGDPLQVLSFGMANPTPWHTAREAPEEELLGRLAELARQVDDPARTFFNVHVPPQASGLDRCPELDTSTFPPTPVKIAGEVQMIDAGSTAVRSVIEDCEPALTLHGHIHECRGAVRIGGTLAINPGSSYAQGVLQGALISWGDGAPRHQLVSG
jgi:Icc-related predicted phosphoesterase